jgi:hypothetical protein
MSEILIFANIKISKKFLDLTLLKQPSEVLAAEGCRPSTFNIEEFNTMLDNRCTFEEGATPTVRECLQFKRTFCTSEDPKRPRGDGDRLSSRHYVDG